MSKKEKEREKEGDALGTRADTDDAYWGVR
jgi:hypothetical protein